VVPGPSVGTPLAAFDLTMLEGELVRLESFRGRPLLIHFFAIRCEPCLEETQLFRKLGHVAYRDGYEILGIAVQDTIADGGGGASEAHGLDTIEPEQKSHDLLITRPEARHEGVRAGRLDPQDRQVFGREGPRIGEPCGERPRGVLTTPVERHQGGLVAPWPGAVRRRRAATAKRRRRRAQPDRRDPGACHHRASWRPPLEPTHGPLHDGPHRCPTRVSDARMGGGGVADRARSLRFGESGACLISDPDACAPGRAARSRGRDPRR
jgi:hypothetical protein